MPDVTEYDNQNAWMKVCVPKMIGEGKAQDQAVAACSNMWSNKGKVMKSLAYKSVMLCAELCRSCAAACVNCIQMCMKSQYADTPEVKACMEACHHCIALCELCAAVCESGSVDEIKKVCMDCMQACQTCYDACIAAVHVAPDCKDACSYCADVCDRCNTECQQVCGMNTNTGDMGGMTMKQQVINGAVKAIGEWKLDVLPVPFGTRDSDGQWFDENTDIMHEAFTTPLVVYQHGIKQGARQIDDKPVIPGNSVSGTLKKKTDGWHIEILLDQAKAQAKRIMDAAWKHEVAVSSGSITHLARLDIGGKMMQYEKSRPGRIAVWPLGEISLWEKGNGNANPANRFAVALPAMKAMYREAGLPFPTLDTHGAVEADFVKQRAVVRAEALKILERTQNMEK